MAKGPRRGAADDGFDRRRISSEEKIARLLALLLIKDINKKTDAVPMLRRAGFEVSVARLLGITENHVKVADHLG
jgi:hypothetical protein